MQGLDTPQFFLTSLKAPALSTDGFDHLDERQEHRDNDATDDHRQKHNHHRLNQ